MLASILTLALLSAGRPADEVPRPDRLPPKVGCTDWTGTASGNDPSVVVRLQLCGDGNAVSGSIQWSSRLSGWTRRAIEGTRDANGRLALRDLGFLEDRPALGWRFCLVDHYDLSPAGDALAGTYDSAACSDHASLDLRRVR